MKSAVDTFNARVDPAKAKTVGILVDDIQDDMSLMRLFTECKLLKRLRRQRRKGYSILSSGEEKTQDASDGELSVRRIKVLLEQAWHETDDRRKKDLLAQADLLESQLIAVYNARGRIVTATNIKRTIIRHKQHLQHNSN